ncbi:hypothetical protein SLE2022_002740 [Rubroshorea leprosula]
MKSKSSGARGCAAAQWLHATAPELNPDVFYVKKSDLIIGVRSVTFVFPWVPPRWLGLFGPKNQNARKPKRREKSAFLTLPNRISPIFPIYQNSDDPKLYWLIQ